MTARRRRFVGPLLAALTAGVMLLAGCSSDAYLPRPDHPVREVVAAQGGSTATPPEDAGPTAAVPTADPTTAAPAADPTSALPAGFHTVDVPEIGISVAVPDDMDVMDPAVLKTGEAGRLIDEMAGRMGLTHEQMMSALQQFVLFAVAPGGANINMVRIGTRQMPTAKDIRPMLVQMGVTDLTISQRTSAIGTVLAARGALAVPGGQGVTVYEENVYAMSPDHGLFTFTVTAPSASALDALFETELASLQPLP